MILRKPTHRVCRSVLWELLLRGVSYKGCVCVHDGCFKVFNIIMQPLCWTLEHAIKRRPLLGEG